MSPRNVISFKSLPLTRWSTLMSARNPDPDRRWRAVDRLVQRYYAPLKAHLVYIRRLPPDRAEDVLHDFVRTKIVEQDLLARVEEGHGRFRSFLLTALDRFMISELRREKAQKRRGDRDPVPLEDVAERVSDGRGADQERSLDVEWARAVLAESLQRMCRACTESECPEVWSIFELRVVGPAVRGEPPLAYEELVARLHIPSPAVAYNLLTTAKRMYGRCLESVIAEYAGGREEARLEVGDLCRILSRASSGPVAGLDTPGTPAGAPPADP